MITENSFNGDVTYQGKELNSAEQLTLHFEMISGTPDYSLAQKVPNIYTPKIHEYDGMIIAENPYSNTYRQFEKPIEVTE